MQSIIKFDDLFAYWYNVTKGHDATGSLQLDMGNNKATAALILIVLTPVQSVNSNYNHVDQIAFFYAIFNCTFTIHELHGENRCYSGVCIS